jgi:hypothetical protein
VTRGDTTVTPQTRVLTVRLPFGGFVWNRPVAVQVERDGRIERIPIVDFTRLAQLATLGFGLVLSFVIWLGSSRSKELKDERNS